REERLLGIGAVDGADGLRDIDGVSVERRGRGLELRLPPPQGRIRRGRGEIDVLTQERVEAGAQVGRLGRGGGRPRPRAGHRVCDVVRVGPGDPRARLHLDGSGLELKRLDGDVRIRPEGGGGAEGTGQEERGEHRDAANHGPPPLIRLYGRTWPFGFGGQRGRPDLRKMDIPPYRHYERRDATGLLFLVKPASAGAQSRESSHGASHCELSSAAVEPILSAQCRVTPALTTQVSRGNADLNYGSQGGDP